MKYKIMIALVLLGMAAVPAHAVMVKESCMNDTHLLISYNYSLVTDGTSSDIGYEQIFNCTNNCTNNKCNATEHEVDTMAMWLVYASGAMLFILGVIMGVPYGKLVGKEDIRPGWDTTTVVRYIFFFVGFLLVYLSLAMASRLSSVYGGDANITGAADTAVMVMQLTLVLFLFVFFIELIFYTLDYYMKSGHDKKWKMRGE